MRKAVGWVVALVMALAMVWGLASLTVARMEVTRTVADVLGGGYPGLDWPAAAVWALAGLLSCALVAGAALGVRRSWAPAMIAAVLLSGPFCFASLWLFGVELPLARALRG